MKSDGIYYIVETDSGQIQVIYHKLQAIKLYLVKKDIFSVGDQYYHPPITKQKKPIPFRDYSARIGKIKKELDAKMFNLSLAYKIIYGPEQIGLMKSPYENITTQLGDIIPLDPLIASRILKNDGICYIEKELIDNKVIINYAR